MAENDNQHQWPSGEKRWHQTGWGAAMVLMFLVVAALMVWAIFMFFKIISVSPEQAAMAEAQKAVTNQILEQNLASTLSSKSEKRQLAEKTDRPSFGNQEAKLVIVEFGDFDCHLCAQEFPVIREIASRYRAKLLFIFRQFPIISENSLSLAEASLCAEEQGKFWAMHDRLFLSQDIKYSADNLNTIAKSAGLDLQLFESCVKSERQKAEALADGKDALALGVAGTPTFFVNGNKLAGVISKEQWETVINKALELLK